jgi:hypothetical protein
LLGIRSCGAYDLKPLAGRADPSGGRRIVAHMPLGRWPQSSFHEASINIQADNLGPFVLCEISKLGFCTLDSSLNYVGGTRIVAGDRRGSGAAPNRPRHLKEELFLLYGTSKDVRNP